MPEKDRSNAIHAGSASTVVDAQHNSTNQTCNSALHGRTARRSDPEVQFDADGHPYYDHYGDAMRDDKLNAPPSSYRAYTPFQFQEGGGI